MAITKVFDRGTALKDASAGITSFSSGETVDVNDLVFVVVGSDNASSNTPTITASTNGTATLGGWSILTTTSPTASSAAGAIVNVARAFVTSAGTIGDVTATLSPTVTAKSLMVLALRGVDTSTPIASSGTFNGSIASPSIGVAPISGEAILHAIAWEGPPDDYLATPAAPASPNWTVIPPYGTWGSGAASNCTLAVTHLLEVPADPGSGYVQTDLASSRDSSQIVIRLTPAATGGSSDKTSSDVARPKVTESISVDVIAPASDSLAPKVTESILVENAISGSDSIKPKVTESVAIQIDVLLADTLSPKVSESTQISASVSISDDVKPKVTDSMSTGQNQLSVKFYNGSAWVAATAVKSWNGSAWVNVTGIKKYNGSSWT